VNGEAPPSPPSLPGAIEALPPLPSRRELLWFQVARSVVYAVSVAAWRYRVVDADKLPQTTPYVLAPVHRSYLDTLFAGAISSRRARFMAKSGVFARPWAARLFSSLGGFPVKRGTPDREALLQCERALAAGEPVVLFPEGTRERGPVLAPLLGGPAFVALRANVPIVPLGIGGSERAMPVGARWVHFNRVVVVVGDPIWPPPRPATGRVPRREVDELTERLRAGLQEAFDQARAMAGAA
jgi:1-acyl-sn-glycerol-3-phosphate acyltransferase